MGPASPGAVGWGQVQGLEAALVMGGRQVLRQMKMNV